MGLTYVKVRGSNLMKPEAKAELELLVDTGSMLCWMPRKVLEELDIAPRAVRRLRPLRGRS